MILNMFLHVTHSSFTCFTFVFICLGACTPNAPCPNHVRIILESEHVRSASKSLLAITRHVSFPRFVLWSKDMSCEHKTCLVILGHVSWSQDMSYDPMTCLVIPTHVLWSQDMSCDNLISCYAWLSAVAGAKPPSISRRVCRAARPPQSSKIFLHNLTVRRTYCVTLVAWRLQLIYHVRLASSSNAAKAHMFRTHADLKTPSRKTALSIT